MHTVIFFRRGSNVPHVSNACTTQSSWKRLLEVAGMGRGQCLIKPMLESITMGPCSHDVDQEIHSDKGLRICMDSLEIWGQDTPFWCTRLMLFHHPWHSFLFLSFNFVCKGVYVHALHTGVLYTYVYAGGMQGPDEDIGCLLCPLLPYSR